MRRGRWILSCAGARRAGHCRRALPSRNRTRGYRCTQEVRSALYAARAARAPPAMRRLFPLLLLGAHCAWAAQVTHFETDATRYGTLQCTSVNCAQAALTDVQCTTIACPAANFSSITVQNILV